MNPDKKTHEAEMLATKSRIDDVYCDWIKDDHRGRKYHFQDFDGTRLWYELRMDYFDGNPRPNGPNPVRSQLRMDKSALNSGEPLPRHLYRVCELIKADVARPVYVVEGPYKVEWLRSWGLLATCNAMGAGKWHMVSPESKELLTGRDVIILADPDTPGRNHVRTVAEDLKGKAKSVRVVDLDKKVVALCREELDRLITEAPVISTSETAPVDAGKKAERVRAEKNRNDDTLDSIPPWMKPGAKLTTKKVERKTKMPEPVTSVTAVTGVTGGLHPFPLDVLPEGVRVYVEELATSIGISPDIPAMATLTVAGGLMGAKCSVKVKRGWVEKPCLYVALVLGSGEGKSPALRSVMAPVRGMERDLREMYETNIKKYEEAEDKATVEKPVYPRLTIDDFTGEKLAPILRDNPNGVILSKDELAAWVRSMDMYRGGVGPDRQRFLSIWSGTKISVDRAKHDLPIEVDNPFVTVIGCIPPSQLDRMNRSRDEEGDGLLERLLVVCPPPGRRPTDLFANELSKQAIDNWDLVLNSCLRLFGEVNIDAGGREVFNEGYEKLLNEMEGDGLNPLLKSCWNKMTTHAARIALILHGLHNLDVLPPVLSPAVIRDAWSVCEFLKSHLIHAHGQLDPEIEDKVKRAVGNGAKTARDVMHKVYALRKSADLVRTYLRRMADTGIIKDLGNGEYVPLP